MGELFTPRHGDIAYYEDCMPGGDPYRVTLVWRHRDPAGQGWYNVAGIPRPLDVEGHELHLLVRDGRLAARAAHDSDLAAKVAALADEWRAEGKSLVEHCDSARDVHEGTTLEQCGRQLATLLADPSDTGDGSGT